MSVKGIVNWIDANKFLTVVIVLVFMWFWIIGFVWLKADAVLRDPCSICSKRHGDQVTCTVGGIIPNSKIYYPNGSVWNNRGEVANIIKEEVEKQYKFVDNLSDYVNFTIVTET